MSLRRAETERARKNQRVQETVALQKLGTLREPLLDESAEVREQQPPEATARAAHRCCKKPENQMRISPLEARAIERAFRENPELRGKLPQVLERLNHELPSLTDSTERQTFDCPLLEGTSCLVHESAKPIGCLAWNPGRDWSPRAWRAFEERDKLNDEVYGPKWQLRVIPLWLKRVFKAPLSARRQRQSAAGSPSTRRASSAKPPKPTSGSRAENRMSRGEETRRAGDAYGLPSSDRSDGGRRSRSGRRRAGGSRRDERLGPRENERKGHRGAKDHRDAGRRRDSGAGHSSHGGNSGDKDGWNPESGGQSRDSATRRGPRRRSDRGRAERRVEPRRGEERPRSGQRERRRGQRGVRRSAAPTLEDDARSRGGAGEERRREPWNAEKKATGRQIESRGSAPRGRGTGTRTRGPAEGNQGRNRQAARQTSEGKESRRERRTANGRRRSQNGERTDQGRRAPVEKRSRSSTGRVTKRRAPRDSLTHTPDDRPAHPLRPDPMPDNDERGAQAAEPRKRRSSRRRTRRKST